MNILVIGDSRITPSLYGALARLPGTHIRHCRTESEAINVLRLSREPWAGILLEGACGQRDNITLARTLNAVCADIPIAFVRHFQSNQVESTGASVSHCTVERTADGQYLLHCALRNAEWNTELETPSSDSPFDSPWMFEFSAPCKVNR